MNDPALAIVVGSENPIKLQAVQTAAARMFPDRTISVRGASVSSGVSNQPSSNDESFQGAVNRANAARLAAPEADLWVGIEGGAEEMAVGLAVYAWIAVTSTTKCGYGRTATFFLPEAFASLVRCGSELGNVSERLLGDSGRKTGPGAIASLTHNAIDRCALYSSGVILALIPFSNE